MTDRRDKKTIYPLFGEGIIRDDHMYAFDNRLNAMCKVNLRDMSMDILENYESGKPLFAKRIFEVDDTFVLQHERTLNLVVYDKKEGTYSAYSKGSSAGEKYNVIQLQKELIFIPLNWTNEIIVFDVEKREYSEQKHFHVIKDEPQIVLRPVLYKNSIIFPTQNENSFFRIETEEKIIDQISLISRGIIPHIAKTDGDYLWVIEDKAEKLYGFGKESVTVSIPAGKYGDIAVLEKHICLMPLVGFPLVIVSKEDRAVMTLGEISEVSNTEMYGRFSSHVYCAEDHDHIYLFPNNDGFILKINKKGFEMEHCGFVCKEYEKMMMKRHYGNDLIRFEEKGRGLSQFLEMIK